MCLSLLFQPSPPWIHSYAHVVAVSHLAAVSQAGVELDHLVLTVESHLVAAELDSQL